MHCNHHPSLPIDLDCHKFGFTGCVSMPDVDCNQPIWDHIRLGLPWPIGIRKGRTNLSLLDENQSMMANFRPATDRATGDRFHQPLGIP
jgi:hypothetical protein